MLSTNWNGVFVMCESFTQLMCKLDDNGERNWNMLYNYKGPILKQNKEEVSRDARVGTS
jgi:hypothetical protein